MTQNPALADRYGAPRRSLTRRGARILIVLGLLAGVAVAVWLAAGVSAPGVSFKDVGFRTDSSSRAEIDFEVSKDAGATAVCAVKALSETYAVVGWKEVRVGPEPERRGTVTTSLAVPLRTESAAVSAVVDSCWIAAG